MKSYFLRHVRTRIQPNPANASRPSHKALAFVAVDLVVLILTSLLIFGRSTVKAQTAPRANGAAAGNVQTVGSMSDVMVSMVYPAANNILLSVYRGGPQDEKEWVAIERDAVLLAESGNVLVRRGPATDDWARDAKMLTDAAAAAYQAAHAKDRNALLALNQPLNASCTACHKQYRPNIAGPRERRSAPAIG